MDGFAIIGQCLDVSYVNRLCEEFSEAHGSQRNILALPAIQQLATSSSVRKIMETVLGHKCFATRGIFFNKTPSANWKIVWHQDLTIAVAQRKEVDGFHSWTMKDGVQHVQPPTELMSNMLSIRLHLDESGPENAPLRVIAGSHSSGRFSPDQIVRWREKPATTCCVPRGGALLMRPMLLHASSSCQLPKPRRVIHLEFAATGLPCGLEWHERI